MRRGAIFLFAAILTLCGAMVPAVAKGWLDLFLKKSDAPGAELSDKPVRLYGASKALVIGIDNYTHGWSKLRMAIADAKAVRDTLENQGFTVTYLTDLKSADLDRVFKEFFVKQGADKEARLLVWFAGHGHTIDGEGYLVPADAPNPEADEDFRLSALPLRRFGEYMRDARSKHVLAVFDSCFGGSVFHVADRGVVPSAVSYATAQPVRQFVSSGEAEQVVSDNGEFRRLFVDALEGRESAADPNKDGYVTGGELGQFLFDKVTNYTKQRQTPRWGKLNERGYDRGDFVFEKGQLAAPPAAPEAPAAQSADQRSEAAQAWALVKDSTDAQLLEAFKKQYGGNNVFFDQLAVNRLAALLQGQRQKIVKDPKLARRVEQAALAKNPRAVAKDPPTDAGPLGQKNERALAPQNAQDKSRSSVKRVAVLSGHTGEIVSAEFSSDGTRIVTASTDSTARIWTAEDGKQRALLTRECVIGKSTSPLNCPTRGASFNSDAKLVVTASWDKSARIWDAATGRQLLGISGDNFKLDSAIFSPDDGRVATLANTGAVSLWEASTGRKIAAVATEIEYRYGIAFSPDGKWLVSGRSNDVVVWSGTTGREFAVLKGQGGVTMQSVFSRDGKYIAAADTVGTVRIWDFENGVQRSECNGREGTISSIAFSPDGEELVAAAQDGTARIWNTATGQLRTVLSGHTDWLHTAYFSPKGDRIVTASEDGTALLWDAASGRKLSVLDKREEPIRTAVFSPDGTRIVTAGDDGIAKVWQIDLP